MKPKSSARKTSPMPTLTWTLGCLAPTENADLFREQLFKAHRYQNVLTEIEKNRRAAREQMERAMHPRYRAAAEACDELEAQQEKLRAAVKAQRQSSRSRSTVDIAPLDEVNAALRDAAAERKAARTELSKDDSIKAMWRDVTIAAGQLRKAARQSAVAAGLYWSTEALVSRAAEQAAKTLDGPRFHRWDGTGRVGVQIQRQSPQEAREATETAPARKATKGKPPFGIDALFSGAHTMLRMAPVPEDTFFRPRHQRRLASRTTARLRIGSNGRDPVWVTVPVIMHRPFPSDAEITWAWILCRRVGMQYEYRLQFSLETTTARAPVRPRGEGTVAVNFGWRRAGDRSLRVCYWQDDAGHGGEYCVPASVNERIRHADSIRGIADQNLDAVKTELLTWLLNQVALPPWLKRLPQTLSKWRSGYRLHDLLEHWRGATDRPAGDEQILALLEAWGKRFRHLTRYESHERDRAINHRTEQYRLFSLGLARRYDTILIDTLKMPDVRSVPKPEVSSETDGRPQRRQADVSAPGELRELIVERAKRHGVRVEVEESAMKTQRCHLCGCEDRWDAAPAVMHTCTGCGETWDQDYNNCRNLLAEHGYGVAPQAMAAE